MTEKECGWCRTEIEGENVLWWWQNDASSLVVMHYSFCINQGLEDAISRHFTTARSDGISFEIGNATFYDIDA